MPDRQAVDEPSAVMKECQENKISKAFLNLRGVAGERIALAGALSNPGYSEAT